MAASSRYHFAVVIKNRGSVLEAKDYLSSTKHTERKGD